MEERLFGRRIRIAPAPISTRYWGARGMDLASATETLVVKELPLGVQTYTV
jgi:hypothetical protein